MAPGTMMSNRLAAALGRGEVAVNAWLCLPDPLVAETVAAQGYHSVTIDLQHGMIGFESALAMLQGVNTTDCVPLVRVAENEGSLIMRVLDAGALGVICPMINDREECENFVAACRYPPRGVRSFGPARAMVRYGAGYTGEADDAVMTFAMIETRTALENLDDIMTVAGLSGILVGPNDLSLALGYPAASESEAQEVESVIRAIAATARRHRIAAAIYCSGVAGAKQRIAEGYNIVTPFTDLAALANSAALACNAFVHPGNGSPETGTG